ncbi:hypothetical protein F511_29435 [Dorcoceras hygrometricum]|uniref:Late embryogenesis abundant protein LEA-2 subgroup domain-containing protein n=1 Tax=Dorcoceras hygrometricum TaxID=472368 RepID=A0A2Z7D8Q6_9LAMI|nr:hypothetical protein F511_29435 [Dorcoceras hygrometricum]
MADKDRRWFPVSFTDGGSQIDDEQRRRRRKKCLIYLFLLGTIKAGITLLFLLTVLRFRTPKFRIRSATFETFDYSAAPNPSFHARMRAELTVKNANFIKYKFPSSDVSFYYNGERLGTAFVPGSRARARSTEEWDVVVELSAAVLISRDQLGSDLRSGFLMLNGRSRLNGKVELLKLLKKKKSTDMDCIISIDLNQRMSHFHLFSETPMVSKEQELPNIPPAANANGHAHRDTEAASNYAGQQRSNKRRKCLVYIVLFIIFQSAVIALFTLTVMKIRTPKLSVRSATFNNLNIDNSTAKPSFSARMNVELRIKNSNFGRFNYKTTTIRFSYRGTSIGAASVSESYAKWKSTKRFVVAVDLDFAGAQSDPRLVSDLDVGVVPISSQAELRGRVKLLYVMKKNISSDMNCSMEILTGSQQLGNVVCS